MKHWKAYIKVIESNTQSRQYVATVAAQTEYDAANKLREQHGQNCIIGWIKETRLNGLQSIGY
jgi:hypothetical protein